MNYTAPAPSLGVPLYRHTVFISNIELQTLNAGPVLLTNGGAMTPVPTKGVVIMGMTLRGQTIANTPNIPFYIGDLTRLRDNVKFCWSEFSIKDVPNSQLFNIHLQQNPKKAEETHWNVQGDGLSNLEVWLYQNADSNSFQSTGFQISIYWIDEYNY